MRDLKKFLKNPSKKLVFLSDIMMYIIYLIIIGTSIFTINSICKNQELRKSEKEAIEIAKKVTEKQQLLAKTEENTKKKYDENIKNICDSNEYLKLVNKNMLLDKNYKPQDLIIPKVKIAKKASPEIRQMRKEAAEALEKMFYDARRDDINLMIVSAYRSYDSQEEVYENKLKNAGIEETNKYVAKPGSSEHQTGLAVDINGIKFSDLNEDFAKTKEGLWIKDNCSKYGFIIRYPKGKETITGYSYEPWHIRYVGLETAKIITEKGITLDEYLLEIAKNKI
ncbi:D-alanyl-D-alanine carboxypeptidase [Clostridium cavendishii DSM 21758]|uniref:D-alanyl-D-alanine carboxypeptidase n=1 Tax=Clostridium cavendishii DSM 21758 TaxID=1121302 RepID=A0A1M6F4Y2_9CLOT|nr:M15 family metallopeptidase [Clostridium cavendishii]SHI92778.1 D-alanyl-D-alanine carboxypeptidase [Clostridium cavendishii DSM 21758]